MLTKLEDDCVFLDKPAKFPLAYEAACTERERRGLFLTSLGYMHEKIVLMLKSEQAKRGKFAKKFGRYLPQENFEDLEGQTPQLLVLGLEEERLKAGEGRGGPKAKEFTVELIRSTFSSCQFDFDNLQERHLSLKASELQHHPLPPR